MAPKSGVVDGKSRREVLGLFEATADGVFAVCPDQRIVFWNEAAERLLVKDAGSVLGRRCYDVVAGGDYQSNPFCRRNCPTMAAIKQGRPVENYDISCKAGDDRNAWLNMSVFGVDDPQGKGKLGIHVFRDVTERRRAEMLAAQTIEAVSRFQPSPGERTLLSPAPAPRPQLTRREQEVLRLLASGASIDGMVEVLGIRRTTVRNHIEHILGKLGVHSRLEAVVYAARYKLV